MTIFSFICKITLIRYHGDIMMTNIRINVIYILRIYYYNNLFGCDTICKFVEIKGKHFIIPNVVRYSL